jgi:hypothetical protein
MQSENGYKDKYILGKIDEIVSNITDLRNSYKVLNDHSAETKEAVIRLQETLKPVVKIVYGLVGIILTGVILAILTLVIIK